MINSAYDRFVWEIEQADRKIIVSIISAYAGRRSAADKSLMKILMCTRPCPRIDDLQYKDITPDIRPMLHSGHQQIH